MQQLSTKPICKEEEQAAIEAWISSLNAPILSRIMAVPSDDQTLEKRDSVFARARRKAEFAAGRRCAESLLKRLGNTQQVWVNEDRSPAWPDGFAGSISHSKNWTWATIAEKKQIISAGIDTELIISKETREEIIFEIATVDEWEACQRFDLSQDQIFSIIFSAKEAFYKCCYPRVKTFFGFEHAVVEDLDANKIVIRPHESHPCIEQMPESLDVFYRVTEQDVFAITWMEQS